MWKANLFRRKKTTATTKPFKEFYNEWCATLATTLLPQLRRVLSDLSISPALLSTQVEAIHHHLHSYYAALDQAAAADVAQCLYPDWRNHLEKPFLWLGDLHPYLFTNLLRSFLDDQDSSEEDGGSDDGAALNEFRMSREFLEKPWHVATAWRSPPKSLTMRVDQIECGLRLMVPELAARARLAQSKLVNSLGSEGLKAAVEAEMEELVGVVVDANRMRRSVLADVLSVTSVYQAAAFLEALAQFLVGFRHQNFLKEFDKCEILVAN